MLRYLNKQTHPVTTGGFITMTTNIVKNPKAFSRHFFLCKKLQRMVRFEPC